MSGSAQREVPAITLGVEEELFLVDPGTRDLLAEPDPGILAACESRRVVIEAAEEHGAAVMAASTHPFAQWRIPLKGSKRGEPAELSMMRRRTAPRERWFKNRLPAGHPRDG